MKEWKGCITVHRNTLHLKMKDGFGKWVERSTGLEDTPANRSEAKRKLADVRRTLLARAGFTDNLAGAVTVRQFAQKWLAERRAQGVADWKNDQARLKHHVFELIGDMELGDVKPRHAKEIDNRLRQSDHAPRTIRNVYYLMKALFRDAEIEGLIPRGQNPCILTKRQLGKLKDKKTGWRHGAVCTRSELEALTGNEQLPEDHRVWNALLSLGMLRTGEAAGLRLRHLDLDVQPLGRMMVMTSYDDGDTKTEMERWMPIHPTLRRILAEWLLSGWARAFGRPPGPDDLICPVTPENRRGRKKEVGSMRDRHYSWKRVQANLRTLGFRPRRAHDLRRTGISLARGDGASEGILKWGTHAPPRDVMNLYTSIEWEKLCAEVAKLSILLRPSPRARVVALPQVAP